MPVDRFAEPFPEATYNGFAGPPPAAAQPVRPVARRWPLLLAIGGAAAIVLGAGAGLLIRPNLASHDTDAAERAAPGVPIEIDRAPPEAVQPSNGKLEVLPPGQAAAARPPAEIPIAPVPAYQPGPVPPLPPVAAAPSVSSEAPIVRAPPSPAYAARIGDPCAAGSPAEQMVCADPGLQAADRELNRAYRRALAAGVPSGDLRREQRDWLAIREEAAHRSPRAVASIYDQRIDELNGMADDARRDARDRDGDGDADPRD